MKVDEDRLKNIMASVLGVSQEDIGEDLSPDNVERWDSINHLNLILAIEEEFGVIIPEDEITELSSYRILKLTLQELLNDK